MIDLDRLRDLDPPAFLPGEEPPLSQGGMGHYSPDGELLDGDLGDMWTKIGMWKSLPENHRVTELGHDHAEAPHARVSTVYLGLDNRYFPGAPILTWETMIFSDQPDLDQNFMWRYSTRFAAMAGHQQVVDVLAEIMGDPPRTEVELPGISTLVQELQGEEGQ